MRLAGISIRDQDVLELARLLRDAGFDDTAEALIVALEAGQANRCSHDPGSRGDPAHP